MNAYHVMLLLLHALWSSFDFSTVICKGFHLPPRHLSMEFCPASWLGYPYYVEL
eukprot:c38944_g1_i1 orf=23-184(-)